MKIAAILLAAGRANRFGSPKLAAKVGGRPLATHAAATLAALPLACRISVVGKQTPELADLGFECVALEPVDAPLSRSIALGVERAMAFDCDVVLIALADMPFVPLAHFEALIERFDGGGIGTWSNGNAMPPALFGKPLFPALLGLQGDTGARGVLQTLPSVTLPPNLALDIDTPCDLERAREYLRELSASRSARVVNQTKESRR